MTRWGTSDRARTRPCTDTDIDDWGDDLGVAVLIVYTHADNEKRVSQIVVNPGFDTTLWEMCCHLELLDRVRVVRHYPGSAAYVLDQGLAIQGIHHHIEGTGKRVPGVWQVTYDTVHALPMTDGVGFCKWDVGAWDTDCRWSI